MDRVAPKPTAKPCGGSVASRRVDAEALYWSGLSAGMMRLQQMQQWQQWQYWQGQSAPQAGTDTQAERWWSQQWHNGAGQHLSSSARPFVPQTSDGSNWHAGEQPWYSEQDTLWAHGQDWSSTDKSAAHAGSEELIANGSEDDFFTGRLKSFSHREGYGFIACPRISDAFGRDVYVHCSQLPDGASCGCLVAFQITVSSKGHPQAHSVVMAEDTGEVAADAVAKLCRDFLGTESLDGATVEKADSSAIRVVTWNVLADGYTTLKVFPDVDPAFLQAPRRRAQIIAALKALKPDIICLQEVDCPLTEIGLSQEEFDSVAAQRPAGRCDRCVIAWRKDQFQRGPAGYRCRSYDDWPPPEDIAHNPRAFEHGNVGLAVELQRLSSDGGGKRFIVATTHLCWEPSKDDVRAWQMRSLLNLTAELEGVGAGMPSTLVLCGDLNSYPGSAVTSTLQNEVGLVSAYQNAEYSAVTNSNSSACEGGYAAMIDYIWFCPRIFSLGSRIKLPSGDDLRLRKMGHLPGAKEGPEIVPTMLHSGWPSDHLALGADLKFIEAE